jgi:hypothetical protein
MHESSAIIGFIGRLPSQNFMNSDRSCPPVSGSPDIMTLRLRLAELFNVRWTINVVRSSAPLSSILVDPIILTIGLRRRDELGLNSGELFSETRDGGLQSMTNRTSHRLTIVTYPAYDFHIIATKFVKRFRWHCCALLVVDSPAGVAQGAALAAADLKLTPRAHICLTFVTSN